MRVRKKTMKKKLIEIEDLTRKLDIRKKPLPTPPAYGFLMKEEPPEKTGGLWLRSGHYSSPKNI
jgi:hypothetical protein